MPHRSVTANDLRAMAAGREPLILPDREMHSLGMSHLDRLFCLSDFLL